MKIIVILALIAIAVVLHIKIKTLRRGESSGAFKAKKLLTPNEIEFINRLELSCPELRFNAQVSMGAIIEPSVSRRDNFCEYMSLRGKVAQKVIDFVVQDRESGEIVAIIELDDKSHDSSKDFERDQITESAGYRTIRWESKAKPSVEEIREALSKL